MKLRQSLNLFIKALAITSVLLSNSVAAKGRVTNLTIENNILVFTSDYALSNLDPACVADPSLSQWAVSLASSRGQSIYALLLTAVANDLPVAIQSAYDCADLQGVERPESISIVWPQAQQ